MTARPLAALLLVAGAARAQPPSFTGLGDLAGGGFNSSPTAISPDGRVVVGSGFAPTGPVAMRWTSQTGMVALGITGANNNASRADGVSAAGDFIIGVCWGSGTQSAFSWTPVGGMVPLSPPLPASASAVSMTPDGNTMVGYWSTPAGLELEAFRWRASDGFLALGDLPGGNVSSVATSVSADGSVVVGSSSSTSSGSNQEAFRWTASTGMVGLGCLPGGTFRSNATRVSADGSVVVGFSASSATSFDEAFRWTAASGMVALGSLPSQAHNSAAQDVSADGSVIVGWSNSASGQTATIWTAATGTLDLRQHLISLGTPGLTNWRLEQAYATSADGRTITGAGLNPSGQFEAWIAYLGGPPCFANCDGSTSAPALNVNDFQCFINKYAAGDTYANCDHSTAPPILNSNDFQCFLNAFAVGCP